MEKAQFKKKEESSQRLCSRPLESNYVMTLHNDVIFQIKSPS